MRIFSRRGLVLGSILVLAVCGHATISLAVSVRGFATFGHVNTTGRMTGFNTDKTALILTDGHTCQATSTFTRTPLKVRAFHATFTYQAKRERQTMPGDGVALVFQNDSRGLRALGNHGQQGSDLGLGGNTHALVPSAAFEINLYNGVNSVHQAAALVKGLLRGITTHTLPPGDHQGINVRTAGATGRYDSTGPVDFRSGHPIRIHLNYNGITLTARLKDEITGRSFTWSKQIAIPQAVNGNRAYVGFTGASGAATAVQTVSDFSFQPEKPAVLKKQPLADLVNPFIGTGTGPGGSINLFPGPSMPFGMVQLSPDTESRGFGY
ncbi:MAG: hypothetical protein M1472_03910, partial [Planctomycetes bacterium]|nr:hypothetical protein [Planctomycetota bacterium]